MNRHAMQSRGGAQAVQQAHVSNPQRGYVVCGALHRDTRTTRRTNTDLRIAARS